jgi:translocation and assembly module TamA
MSTTRKLIVSFFIYFFTLNTLHAKDTLVFEFNGIQGDILKNVQQRLDIVTKLYPTLTPQLIHTIYAQSPEEIRQAMQPYGYFHTQIHTKLIHNNSSWIAKFDIYPQTQIKISQLSVRLNGPGKTNIAINKLINHFPLQIGDVFRADSYEKAKESLFQVAQNQGYINAQFTINQVIINTHHNTVKINLILNTGPRFYFGKINFQSTPYSYSFLKRFISFDDQTPFSSAKLLELQQAIANSTYFQQVLITPDFKSTTQHEVPINVILTPPKAKKYNVGIGYGTLTGPRLTTSVSFRRLTDTGQHLEAQLKLSSVISEFAAKYYIPGKNPINDEWIMGINYQRFLPKNGSSSSQTISGGYATKSKHTQTNVGINYLIEQYKVKDQDAEHTQLLYPNLNYTYTKSDDLINPTLGKSINLSLRGTSKVLLSSTSFFQTEVKAKYFFTPFDFAHIVMRTDLGYTVTKDLSKLPLSIRFFAGGMNSIRGYSDSDIGPGRYLYTGSIEYQNRIKDNWWGALFYDAGTATNHFGDQLYLGKGVGVFYTSFMGPIKLYVGQGTHKSKTHYTVEFSIGPEF